MSFEIENGVLEKCIPESGETEVVIPDGVTSIGNQLKYENYKEQFRRLNRALASGFNLEAIFIEYAIIEDRTESVLRHAGQWEAYLKHRRKRDPSLESKVNYIKKRAEEKKSLLHKYFSGDLLDEILIWKDQRNRLIHALLKQQLAHNEVSILAAQGNELVKELRSRVSSFNRASEKAGAN